MKRFILAGVMAAAALFGGGNMSAQAQVTVPDATTSNIQQDNANSNSNVDNATFDNKSNSPIYNTSIQSSSDFGIQTEEGRCFGNRGAQLQIGGGVTDFSTNASPDFSTDTGSFSASAQLRVPLGRSGVGKQCRKLSRLLTDRVSTQNTVKMAQACSAYKKNNINFMGMANAIKRGDPDVLELFTEAERRNMRRTAVFCKNVTLASEALPAP